MNCTPCNAPSGMILVPYPSLVHHATISPVHTTPTPSAWGEKGGERGERTFDIADGLARLGRGLESELRVNSPLVMNETS